MQHFISKLVKEDQLYKSFKAEHLCNICFDGVNKSLSQFYLQKAIVAFLSMNAMVWEKQNDSIFTIGNQKLDA